MSQDNPGTPDTLPDSPSPIPADSRAGSPCPLTQEPKSDASPSPSPCPSPEMTQRLSRSVTPSYTPSSPSFAPPPLLTQKAYKKSRNADGAEGRFLVRPSSASPSDQRTYEGRSRNSDGAEDFLGVTPPPTGKDPLPGKPPLSTQRSSRTSSPSHHPTSPSPRLWYECSPPPTNNTGTASAGQQNGLEVRQTVLRKKRIATYKAKRTCPKGDMSVKCQVAGDCLSPDGHM